MRLGSATNVVLWLALSGAGHAAPPIELELVTERGVQITAPHEWLQLLTAIGVNDVRIRGIQPGDEVTAVLPGGDGYSARVQSVFTTRNRLLKVETDDGHLFTTKTQPLCLVDGSIQAAGQLRAGDLIFRWKKGQRRTVRVLTVTATDRLETVFNLILGDGEVFIAGGFLARGKPPAVTSELAPAREHAGSAR